MEFTGCLKGQSQQTCPGVRGPKQFPSRVIDEFVAGLGLEHSVAYRLSGSRQKHLASQEYSPAKAPGRNEKSPSGDPRGARSWKTCE